MTTLKMHTPNLVDSNIERLAELFPNCITEKPKTDEQGKVIRDMNGEVVLVGALILNYLSKNYRIGSLMGRKSVIALTGWASVRRLSPPIAR